MPVSYTHLDVYKRQTLFGTFAQGWLRDAEFERLKTDVVAQRDGLQATRREAQREVNALAARLGELQAEANRLNALGERLTRVAQLGDGEFDFDKPVGIGGAGPVRDMPAGERRTDMTSPGSYTQREVYKRQVQGRVLTGASPGAAVAASESGFGNRSRTLFRKWLQDDSERRFTKAERQTVSRQHPIQRQRHT